MGVQPASIGYEGEMYKVAQDAAHQQTSTFGVGAILQLRKAIYDRLLVLGGWPELEVVDVGQEKESQGDRAKRLVTATGGPYMTLNEGRAEEGKDPIPGGDMIRLAAVGAGVGRAGSAALLDTALTRDTLCSDACDCGRFEASLASGGSLSPESDAGDRRGGVGASERADEAGDDSFAELAEAHFLARADDLARWERKAIKRLKDKQSPACDFQSEFLSDEERSQILAKLGDCGTVEAIREAFGMVRG